MAEESFEKSKITELSKEKLAKAIKTAHKESESKTDQSSLSVCDIMKSNTSQVIQKMQAQIPVYMELFSDLYTKNLHMLDDLYGTCYMSEKEFFDKMPLDKGLVEIWDDYMKAWTQLALLQIETSTNFVKSYVEARKLAIDSYDKYMHMWMDTYAKFLSQFNSFMDKSTGKTK
jgi:hypothetical protein